MKTQLTREQTQQALQELGIDSREFALVQLAATYQEAEERLAVFKAGVKKRYRSAAFRLHPDRGGSKVQQDLFVLCTQLYEEIQALKVRRPPQVVVMPTRYGTIKIRMRSPGVKV